MGSRSYQITITDFREDPADDTAFGIVMEVTGPANFVEVVRVSFDEEFVRILFKIPWTTLNLAAEDHRLVKEKREVFIQLALVKVEQWIDEGTPEKGSKMIVTPDRDLKWAAKIADQTHRAASVAVPGTSYTYTYTP